MDQPFPQLVGQPVRADVPAAQPHHRVAPVVDAARPQATAGRVVDGGGRQQRHQARPRLRERTSRQGRPVLSDHLLPKAPAAGLAQDVLLAGRRCQGSCHHMGSFRRCEDEFCAPNRCLREQGGCTE